MNYEKMIAVNRIESEQKIKLATMAIEQLIERGEYPSVTLLVKKTGLSRGFFYKNPEVRSRLDAAVQSPNVSCRRIWSESKDSKNDNTEARRWISWNIRSETEVCLRKTRNCEVR